MSWPMIGVESETAPLQGEVEGGREMTAEPCTDLFSFSFFFSLGQQ